MKRYLVCDSLGNVMWEYDDKKAAIMHVATFGNPGWKIKERK